MATGKIKTLFSDKEKTEALFPRTKVSAISDDDGAGLDAILDNMNTEIDTKATESFVTNKIAEAQLGGEGGNIDLSGYATKDDVKNIDFPVDSVNGKTGAVSLSAADVGAVPTTRKVNGKALNGDISLNYADVGAAPSGYGFGGAPVSVSNNQLNSEADLNAALEPIYSGMASGETKLVKFYGYPSNSDYNWFGLLSKSSANYGSLLIHSAYDKGDLLVKAKYGGTWQPVKSFAAGGYGLGAHAGMIVTDANEATKNGWYYLPAGSANAADQYEHPMLVVAYASGAVNQIGFFGNASSGATYIKTRKRSNSGWQPWEWVNPPMVVGVEYRTIERFEAGAIVYTQLVDLGATTEGFSVTATATGINRLIRAVPILDNRLCTEWDANSGVNPINAFYFSPEKTTNGVYFYIKCGSGRTGRNLKAQIWYTK